MRMTTPSPEVPKNPENPGTNYELKTLKSNVSADYKKFETLSKDASLKKWLEKIIKNGLKWRIETFAKSHNSISKERVGYYTARMVKNHPELITFISWELWLPIKTDKSRVEYEFSALSFEQKLSFMALYETEYDFWSNLKNVKTKQIIDKYKSYIKQFSEEATKSFNRKVDDNKILGFVNLEKVLKKEYWLTDSECKKMKEYLELVQKHPEYVWWDYKKQIEQAGSGWWYLIAYLIGAATMVLWYYAYQWIFWLKKTEQVASWGKIEMVNFEECFEIMAAKSEHVVKNDNGEDGVKNYKENAIEFNKDGSRWLDPLKDWVETVVNYFEWRSIDMKAKIKVWYSFDAKNAKCFIEKKNWKWIFHVKIKKPTLNVISRDVEVVRSNREKIVNLDKFDDFELRALKKVEEEALESANTPDNLKNTKESLRKSILNVFRATWYAGSGMVIEGKDVQDVIIEYTN